MITKDKKRVLEYVHYTKPKFRNETTIFGGGGEDGLTYNYMDRLFQWDKNKYRESESVAKAKTDKDTAEWYEVFLSHYFDKQIDVRHIVASVGGNGYSYYAIGYVEK